MLQDQYPNQFQCHLDYHSILDKKEQPIGYHSKGYLFSLNNHKEVLIGSSNITHYALKRNIEWDLVSEDPAVYEAAFNEFNVLWDKTEPLSDELIHKYSIQLDYAIERWDMDYSYQESNVHPNYMQKRALKELIRYRALGNDRAMVISAAGD